MARTDESTAVAPLHSETNIATYIGSDQAAEVQAGKVHDDAAR